MDILWALVNPRLSVEQITNWEFKQLVIRLTVNWTVVPEVRGTYRQM